MSPSPRITLAAAAAFAFALTVAAPPALAQQVVVVRERVIYPIEVEPHFTFGDADIYGPAGFGGGLRLSIPVAFGHLGRIADNVAISFGGDVVHFGNCYVTGQCDADYLLFPVAAQWNLRLARPFSLLLEGGGYFYKGWYGACGPGCSGPSDIGVLPAVAVGGRFHLSDHVALLLRVGYPMITFGASFF